MNQILDRKALTDLLLSTLRTTEWPIGDAGPPELPALATTRHASWNGQPNAPGSFYVPYAILTPSTITNSSGSFADPQGDAQVPYTLTLYGLNRGQVELLGGKLRVLLAGLRGNTFTTAYGDYEIQQVWFAAVGSVGRVEASDPPTFGEIDTLSVWTTAV